MHLNHERWLNPLTGRSSMAYKHVLWITGDIKPPKANSAEHCGAMITISSAWVGLANIPVPIPFRHERIIIVNPMLISVSLNRNPKLQLKDRENVSSNDEIKADLRNIQISHYRFWRVDNPEGSVRRYSRNAETPSLNGIWAAIDQLRGNIKPRPSLS